VESKGDAIKVQDIPKNTVEKPTVYFKIKKLTTVENQDTRYGTESESTV